ncbi:MULTISPECIES: RagB/SusD family nutrient uptake outer membrane protein [Sphingobacterium]|uniref:RagB/SusD family nutrient uptake outer membrane protein n=1 Tax=Sphingobacterium TaxID=28453 RepID=UPI00257B4143|nr:MULTISPECIES: RagB/SusD family nutrient uptake outer membrane protein [Sphingobacterium]
MKNINYIKVLFAGVLLLASCKKDYLETLPTDSVSTPTVFETTKNAKLAVNGLAKMMTQQYLGSQGFNGEGTIKMYYGNYPGNNFFVNLSGWADIINANYNQNLTSIYLYYPWYYYYKIIGNANQIVISIDGAEGPAVEKDFIKAQALTFRAYSYMMLAQIYGNRWKDSNNGQTGGLVLRTDVSTGDMPLSTLGQTYDLIYKDLNDAIALYESSKLDRESDKNFQVNEDVAYAIYARAALNKQDYVNAEKYAVLARKNYKLMSNADYKNGFSTPNGEWIWSSYGASDETLYFYSFQSYIAYNSTASAVRTTPKCISRELFDKIPTTDVRRDLFLDPKNEAYTTATGIAGTAMKARAFKLFPDLQATAVPFAYMNFKFKANDIPGIGHVNHFRASEMYLIEAEAKFFQNKAASEVQGVLNALNATSGRDVNYVCTKTGTDLLNEIKLYRAVELWGEGFDWFDMKRWGDTIVRKDFANGGNYLTSLVTTIKPEDKNKWTWAIPLRESDYNKGLE